MVLFVAACRLLTDQSPEANWTLRLGPNADSRTTYSMAYFLLAAGSINNHPRGVSRSRKAIRYCHGRWTRCFGGTLRAGMRLNGKYGINGAGAGLSEMFSKIASTTLVSKVRDAA